MSALVLAAMLMGGNDLAQWGGETLDSIRHNYYLPEKKLYGDAVVPGHKPKQVAFNWGCGVLLSALAAGSRSDKRFLPWLREFADRSHVYWNPKGPVPGYDVLPAPKPADRYYDDNAWMVMALCETYDVLGNKKYLDWAKAALEYVLSGEDAKLGGGIYWREAKRTSKNTCSNAPSAAACIAVFRRTGDKALLAKAIQLYDWTRAHLRDPQDGLYWDSIGLGGRLDKTKWSYNTALMIRSAAGLYEETKLPSYRDDALEMVRSSRAMWLKDGKLCDAGRFAHLLLEAWIICGRVLPETALAAGDLTAPLQFLHDSARSPLGFYPGSWSGPAPSEDRAIEMIDQASFARACFEVAQISR